MLRTRSKPPFVQIILFLIAMLLAVLGTLSFFPWQPLLLLPANLLAFFIFRALEKKWHGRRIQTARRLLMLFLQYLCSGMAVGQSLRQLLLQLPQSNFYEQTSDRQLKLKFKKVALFIQTQQTGKSYYPLLLDCFQCPEAEALLHAFKLEQQLGEKMLDLLRESFDSARELLILEEEMAAANNRQSFESLIMSLLPFIMAPLFSDIIQISNAAPQSLILSQSMRLFAFILAILAFFFQLRLSSSASSADKKKDKAHEMDKLSRWLMQFKWLSNIIDRVPAPIRLKLLNCLRLENPRRLFNRDTLATGQWLQLFCLRLIQSFCLSLFCFTLVFSYLQISVLWAFPLATAIETLPIMRVYSKAKENELQMQERLALLLSVLTRLLKNGQGLSSALCTCAEIFSKDRVLAAVLEQMAVRIQHGESSEVLLEAWAATLNLSDASSALYLLARYSHHGSIEILNMLEKQILLCWAEQRQGIRRKLDAKAGALILPMLMDLLSVMLLGAAPAMQIFTAF